MRGDVGVEMTFLERNVTKLRITKEIETILSENSIGINDFEEIVSHLFLLILYHKKRR